ncbi:hypothetical protein RHGRI_016849 [Rhododendron griersonianum]|uniref:Uncharacterized protein n=1 Tax=Rhododendron griersonianum TaxID=479676 RepID=A0AAV6JVT7_9ERIC|nr:hypothetical protein RHGRI_016849 [Rhododendron griersonianum]
MTECPFRRIAVVHVNPNGRWCFGVGPLTGNGFEREMDSMSGHWPEMAQFSGHVFFFPIFATCSENLNRM